MLTWEFDAPLWRWEGPAAWIFVSLPNDIADEIADHAETLPRAGFGSVRVQVRMGASTWSTSVFPDSKRGTYLLPVKKSVRAKSHVDEGDVVHLHLTVVEP